MTVNSRTEPAGVERRAAPPRTPILHEAVGAVIRSDRATAQDERTVRTEVQRRVRSLARLCTRRPVLAGSEAASRADSNGHGVVAVDRDRVGLPVAGDVGE